MKLSFPLIALLLVGIMGVLFSSMIFDPVINNAYSPNTSEYTASGSQYGLLVDYMNQSAQKSTEIHADIDANIKSEDEVTIITIGSNVISALKEVANLENLAIIGNLITTTASILGVNSAVAGFVVTMIFITIIFSIVGALLRWRT
ncbi:MAG: hypothetical protein H8E98_05040 [Bacteroidetes bacterium]|nr:hypothetical protein [Bacteroidota bacterium]